MLAIPLRAGFARAVHHPITAWLILLISFVLTWLAWSISTDAIQKRVRDRFDSQADAISAALVKRMQAYELALRSGAGLFDASSVVTRSEWHQFAASIRLQTYYPGIQGIGVSMMLPGESAKRQFEQAVRAEGFKDFTVHPPNVREVYSSIVYLEPFDWRNQRAFGYDMYQEPVRREAMDRARDSGEAALSGRVTLVQETDTDVQYGFLMYMPFYRQGVPLRTVAERRAALEGFVYSPFRVNDLMAGILGVDQQNIEFELYDGQRPDRGRVIYNNLGKGQGYRHGDSTRTPPDIDALRTVRIAGHDWTLYLYAQPGYLSSHEENQPLFVAMGGIAVDLLLFFIIASIGRKQRETERLVAMRTRDLVAAKEAAEAASLTKSRFLATMSHELRTPMNGVLGMAQLLALPHVDDSTRILRAKTIVDSGLHLQALLNDVLDFSRIEAGKLELLAKPFDPAQLLHDAVATFRVAAQAKGLEIEAVWSGPAPLLNGDPVRIRQMLNNLISNAVKFSEQGTISVHAQIDAQAQPPHTVFKVRDQGVGVPLAAQDKLFQPFSQADASTTRRYEGTGLGLSIVSRLAELMNGDAGFESQEGVGSVFWFRVQLPVV